MQFLLGDFKWINHNHYLVAWYHYQCIKILSVFTLNRHYFLFLLLNHQPFLSVLHISCHWLNFPGNRLWDRMQWMGCVLGCIPWKRLEGKQVWAEGEFQLGCWPEELWSLYWPLKSCPALPSGRDSIPEFQCVRGCETLGKVALCGWDHP